MEGFAVLKHHLLTVMKLLTKSYFIPNPICNYGKKRELFKHKTEEMTPQTVEVSLQIQIPCGYITRSHFSCQGRLFGRQGSVWRINGNDACLSEDIDLLERVITTRYLDTHLLVWAVS
jgi:hypothetical protein